MLAPRTNLVLLLLLCMPHALLAVVGNTYFSIRSQGLNSPRQWVGFEPYDMCQCSKWPLIGDGWIGFTTAFSQSFSDEKLAEYIFFNDGKTMEFGNLGDSSTEVFSRNFLLNDDLKGRVKIDPEIQSLIFDFQTRMCLDPLLNGLYFEAHIPVTWTQWDLKLEEIITFTGTAVPANKLGNAQAEPSFLKSIVRAWMGDTVNVNVFPDVMQDMQFATIDGKRTKVALADVYLTLGWPAICNNDWRLDVQLHYIAPAGNRPEAEFLFEPIAGNGKHHGLGAGLHGYHYVFDHGDTALCAVFDIRGYHLFGTKQRRTFDLKNNGIGSRYLLFKEFEPDGTFAGQVVFGPRVTTLDCHVSIGAQMEGTIMATYDWCLWQLNAGGNAWLRSKEDISLKEDIPSKTFGIQGNTDTTNAQTASRTKINGANANDFDDTTVFLKTEDINTDSSAAPLAVSYKMFAHASRFWDTNPYEPFLGFGGEIEWSAFSNKALEQASLWLKVGFSYK